MLRIAALCLPLQMLRNSYCEGNERFRALRSDNSSQRKTIHFVRHAEGYHNVAGRKDPIMGYLSEDLEDATLTTEGLEQCKRLHAGSEQKVASSQLIVVSPLNRTMQTATHCFPQLIGKVPWIAVECLRERTGLHPCDRRKSITEHKDKFTHIDFSAIIDDEDPLFWKYRLREPTSDVTARARQFMLWLKNRPESEIIVVSHHGYLLNLFGNVILTANPDKDYDDFKNCELRTFIVQF